MHACGVRMRQLKSVLRSEKRCEENNVRNIGENFKCRYWRNSGQRTGYMGAIGE